MSCASHNLQGATLVCSTCSDDHFVQFLQSLQFVYVIAWVAVQFRMNCTSNATGKESISRGKAERYLPSWLHYECNSKGIVHLEQHLSCNKFGQGVTAIILISEYVISRFLVHI